MFSLEQRVLLQHQDVKLFLVGTLHDIERCYLKGSVYLSLQGDTVPTQALLELLYSAY